MKTALVTGSAGFIGQHVTAELRTAGYEVAGADIEDGFDVRHDLGWAGKDHVYDVVVHCAAVVGGRRIIDRAPIRHVANLAIDAALFDWAELVRPRRVVYFSSSCAYPATLGLGRFPLHEDFISLRHPQRPDGLYGWAKLTGELLAQTAADAGVNVSVVRPFSVYGPGMNDGFAVKGFAGQVAQRADPVTIWGDDSQVRDYIHVSDVAAAVLAVITEGVDGPVNLGTGTGTSLNDLAALMALEAGYTPQVKVDTSMPAGVPYLVADTSRLREFYTPKVTLEQGLAEIVKGGV